MPLQQSISRMIITKKVDHSNWAGVGDQVTLRYVNSWKYFDAKSGKRDPGG